MVSVREPEQTSSMLRSRNHSEFRHCLSDTGRTTTASFLTAPQLSRFLLRTALLTDLSCHVAAKQAA